MTGPSDQPIPLEDVLDSLDLPRAEPGIGYLERLFFRFNERVPFETASKIVRDAAVADPGEKPRRPGLFWREHLDSGAGGTCFARVAAFQALLSECGFETRVALGRVTADYDHAAMIVERGAEGWLCDVGFPLPALLPAREGEVETALGTLSVRRVERGFRIELPAGVPEGPRTLEIFDAQVSAEQFDLCWRGTFRPDSRFLREVSLRKQLEARVLVFARGEIRVDDRHSRLTLPLPGPRTARLAELFGIEGALLDRAFERAGDPDSENPGSLRCYLETDVPAEAAFAAIATPEGYRSLMGGVADLEEESLSEEQWRWRLRPPGAAPGSDSTLSETVRPERSELRLSVARRSGQTESRSLYAALDREGKSYLVREAIFVAPREDLLRNDSLRGRLAGSLVLDLLAWSRLLGRVTS